jgi:predicted TIM-barrel fold metal-dependent hydrolase
LRIIDADSHLQEPPDWISVVNPALAAELPPMKNIDLMRAGVRMRAKMLPPELQPEDPLDLMAPDMRIFQERNAARQPDRFDAADDNPFYNTDARLAYCDEQGIDVQFINPSAGILAVTQAVVAGRMDLLRDIFEATNSFLANHCAGHTDRLIPVMDAYPADVDWTVAEMTRMRALGSRAFHVTQDQVKSPTHPDYEPMWSAAEDLGMAAYVHLSFGQPPTHPSWVNNGRGIEGIRAERDMAGRGNETGNFLKAMVFDGVLERHPRLRIIVAENAHSWLPMLIHDMDYKTTTVAMDGVPQEPPCKLPLRPSEYLQRQVKITPLIGFLECGFEWLSLEQLMDFLPSPDMVVFSSDYPHLEGRDNAVARYEKLLPDATVRERFFGASMDEFMAL